MKEITYNGMTVYISDDVLTGVRTYLALHERPLFAPSQSMGAAYAAPPQAPLPYMVPSQASQAPMGHDDRPVYASWPDEAAPAPKRRRRLFSGFNISHKKESAKTERKDSSVVADRPQAPQASPAHDFRPGPQESPTVSYRPQAQQGRPAFIGHTSGSIDDILSNAEDTFQAHLLKLIDKKELTDSEVYKKADIDRRLFSKIRSNPDYRPKKQTALALALALELNIDEAVDLLGRAGYAFSPSSRFDLIARYCIERGIYDLVDVNALLFYYDQPLLGGQM